MATTDMGRPIQGAIYRHIFPLRNTAGALVSAATGLDSEISTESGSFADCTNEATEIGSTGIYYLELTAAEMSKPSVSVLVKSADAMSHFQEIVAESCLHSGTAVSGGVSSITLATTSSATSSLYNGAAIEIVRGTGAGQIRTITAYSGSTGVATVDRAWTTAPASGSVYVIHHISGVPSETVGYVNSDMQAVAGETSAATALAELYKGGVIAGSVVDASPSVSDFNGDTGLSSTDDFYNNMLLVFTTGTLKGYVARINDFTGSSRNFILSSNLPTTPGNGDEFCILSKVF